MSGGSWEYSFTQINQIVEALERDTTLRYYTLTLTAEQKAARRKLAALLERVSNAMHAIEWVDSSDTETPADIEAIEQVFAALPPPAPATATATASDVPVHVYLTVLTDTVSKLTQQVEQLRADVEALKGKQP